MILVSANHSFLNRFVISSFHCKIILLGMLVSPLILYPVYAADPLDQFAFQGILKDSDGNLITATKDFTLQLYTALTGGSSLWSEDHDDVSVSSGLFTIYAGSQTAFSTAVNFTNALYLEVMVKDSDGSNAETLSPRLQVAAAPFALSASRASDDFDLNQNKLVNGTNSPAFFHSKTSTTYTGSLTSNSLTGYLAGNDLCASEFPGTHMCTESEVVLSINQTDISSFSQWSGSAWVITGGSKYSPADLPVNDCNGFTHGTSDTYLGNFWIFDQSDGGTGGVGQCANTLALACCKAPES